MSNSDPPEVPIPIDFDEDTDTELDCPNCACNCANCFVCKGKGRVSLSRLTKLNDVLHDRKKEDPHE